MARKKLAGFAVRRPAADQEDAIRQLEERTEARGQGVRMSKRSNAKASSEPKGKRNVVQRVGRLKADGSRTEARELRRLTVYLDPEVAKAVDIRAAEDDTNRSELIQEALRQYLGA